MSIGNDFQNIPVANPDFLCCSPPCLPVYSFHAFSSFPNSLWIPQDLMLNSGNDCKSPMFEEISLHSIVLRNGEENNRKSKIWRPFTDTSTRRNDTPKLSNCLFYPIKPSNVKIRASKTSVFKAVRKTTFPRTRWNKCNQEHSGMKPFACGYPNCLKWFSRHEELSRHERIHSGVRPHTCSLCGKSFGRKDHLSKHAKTHLQASEKKLYLCPVPDCGHRYTRSDALTRHRSTAHHKDGTSN